MKNVILIIIVVVILAVVALAFLGAPREDQGSVPPPKQDDIVFVEPPPQLPESLYNLIGIVKVVNTDSAIIDADIPQFDEDGNITSRVEERTIWFTPETKITNLSLLTTGANAGRAEELDATISDIPVGGMVEVIADENILDMDEFDVVIVRILPN